MNWNDMSDSEEDSWFDDEPPKAQGETTEATQAKSKQQKQGSGDKHEQSQKQGESPKQAQVKKKFITDQQLLNLYIAKEVDDPKAIKVVRCQNEDVRQIIKQLKTAKVVSIADSTFLLFFNTEEDLIEFFKEKIANRYRFFFHKFQKRVRQDDRNRQPRNRRQNRQNRQHKQPRQPRQRRENRDNRDTRGQRPARRKQKRYEESSDSEEHQRKKKSPKADDKKNHQVREQKSKKAYIQKEAFTIQDNKNLIEILSNGFEISRVMNEIEKKKIFSSFGRIKIKAPISTFEKVSILCRQISKNKFYLETVPQTEGNTDTVVELILVENGKNETMKFYEKYHAASELKANSDRKHSAHEEKVKPASRTLGSSFDDYFKDISKCNLSEIVEGFDEQEYITRFKEASSTIQQKYSTWNIEAQDDNIQMLLKLTNRIKKSTLYDIDLKPSMRAGKAVLKAELRERPEKERRPKVDVANVNNYLN